MNTKTKILDLDLPKIHGKGILKTIKNFDTSPFQAISEYWIPNASFSSKARI